MTKKVVLVTGGTGLVGNGIRIAHERDPRDDETFVFLSSKDADLTDKESTRKVKGGSPTVWLLCGTIQRPVILRFCHQYS